ncbi:hypothetical protein CHS0354_002866 [Potamilus streckersoni]|uniref:Sushi domain-containing protein n=1 Tax=Potamilus streckersoni TaxID=2493646 RepID=A0AAE0SNA4_9BIVA|nr:hypothetical protein CHS0354_002866 [Potamilus streckersoni]
MEVGQNYTYRCQDGVFGKKDQNPTITCLWDGQWAATNFTCGNFNHLFKKARKGFNGGKFVTLR